MEEDHSPNQLQIIGQLAREYEQKYNELEALISEIPPEKAFSQLRALAEHTTDRFRSAQVALFSTPQLFEGDGKETAMLAATALCRAFDEMRILFQFLAASCGE
jgi:hypothetical protein